MTPNLSATDKKNLTAKKISFKKEIDELREFDKRLAAIANEEIDIDLDDAVKLNYEKFYHGGVYISLQDTRLMLFNLLTR